ncbi:unnamed protein product [Protopolystoma xenopodis]|uniref:Uncharacterized protein n=1 Tax=Protopolystoma xenopodis TaxID=117903 RepID=A0A3S5BF64_9PLAT|nr:unnamed protein product [Protopolystoma xenopodis]
MHNLPILILILLLVYLAEIRRLKLEKRKLMSQISSLKEETKHLTCECLHGTGCLKWRKADPRESGSVNHLTVQLEKQADDWRTEADGRKLLVSEVNELTSRLREMEALARAEMQDDQEDPVKLRMGFE